METGDSISSSQGILPTPFEARNRVNKWEEMKNKYINDPNQSRHSVLIDKDLISSDESEDDDSDEEFVDDENVCQQLQVWHPVNDRVRLMESLRPQIAELEKLLPKEVLLYDPPNQQRRRGFARKFPHDNGVLPTDSDDSMCSMEQDNYLRQNMGKRRPNNQRIQKFICKKTIIKKYVVVNSQGPHSYRQNVPFYATHSKSSGNRRRRHKTTTRNRIISDSETDTSTQTYSPIQRKRCKVSAAVSSANERRQVSPVPENDPTVKMKNLSVVLGRLKLPSDDVTVESLLNIGKKKIAPSAPNSYPRRKRAFKKKIPTSNKLMQVTPPRRSVLEKPNRHEQEDIITISSDTDVGEQIDMSREQRFNQVPLLRSPATNELEKTKQLEPQDVIDISSDTDDSGRNMAEMSFEKYSWARNETHRLNQEVDSDDLDMVNDYLKFIAGKDVPIRPAHTNVQELAFKGNCDRSRDILVYRGVSKAAPDAKVIVDRCLLEASLGKELTDTLLGPHNNRYRNIIPATFSVFYRPQKERAAVSSSDDDACVPRTGVLKFYDAADKPY